MACWRPVLGIRLSQKRSLIWAIYIGTPEAPTHRHIRPEFGVVCASKHLLEVRLVRREYGLSDAILGHYNLLSGSCNAKSRGCYRGHVLDGKLVAQCDAEPRYRACG
jgi:hypothetical protein